MFTILAVTNFLTWDDPSNPVGTVAGYNVYKITRTGTGTIIKQKLNVDLIPWVPDTAETPRWDIIDVYPSDELRGTAVGYKPELGDENESELSDDFWIMPFPPAAVPSLRSVTEQPTPLL